MRKVAPAVALYASVMTGAAPSRVFAVRVECAGEIHRVFVSETVRAAVRARGRVSKARHEEIKRAAVEAIAI